MHILGIETSCDETAAAVVMDGTRVLSNVIASAKDAFLWSGGVIPEEAARKQVECILPVITQALSAARITHEDLDAIAVTKGPGLLGSLLVGTVTARVLAHVWQKPLIGIHHHLGHLSSPWLTTNDKLQTTHSPRFPIITLTVSGGHTELWLRQAHTSGELLGWTRDDAAGEAFDKGASLLGLSYPGGPAIAAAAEGGNPHAFPFPLPLKGDNTLDFSFSGLKTALKYLLRDLKMCHPEVRAAASHEGLCSTMVRGSALSLAPHHDTRTADLAASYQHAICHHLCDRTLHALARFPHVKELHLVGGVSANRYLRKLLQTTIGQRSTVNGQLVIRWPIASEYCTDNAAMIAAAAEFLVAERGWPKAPFATDASLHLTEVGKAATIGT